MNIKEKLALTSQLNTLLADLTSESLSIGERLAKSRERIEILTKLKASVNAPEPAQEEPQAEQESDTDTISLDAFKSMSRSERVQVLDTVLWYENWPDYEQVFFPSYQVIKKTDKWVTYADTTLSGNPIMFGYRGSIARGSKFWAQDAGKASANGGGISYKRSDRNFALKQIAISSKLAVANSEILKQNGVISLFRSGAFLDTSPDVFREKMKEVSKAGLDLSEIGQGVIDWYKTNPDRLVA